MESLGRTPVQNQPRDLSVFVAEGVVASLALLPGPAFLDASGKRSVERRGQGAADEAAEVIVVEPAVSVVKPGCECTGGFGGDEIDRPCGRVLSIEGSLRAFEDLDAIQIQQNALG